MMMESRRIEELKRRVQTDPASIAFAALAEEYRRAGRLDDAIATCIAGLKRHPSYGSARVTLACALQGAGRLSEARAEFEAVLRSAPENLAAIRGLAEIDERLAHPQQPPSAPPGNPDPQLDALEAFLGAIRAARTHPEQGTDS
jgi:tetratricopeptide (TPR) repeat protein